MLKQLHLRPLHLVIGQMQVRKLQQRLVSKLKQLELGRQQWGLIQERLETLPLQWVTMRMQQP